LIHDYYDDPSKDEINEDLV